MEIKRRNRMDKWHPVEKAIYDTMQEIEKMGADVKLTQAQIKLDEAKNLISDFIDENNEVDL